MIQQQIINEQSISKLLFPKEISLEYMDFYNQISEPGLILTPFSCKQLTSNLNLKDNEKILLLRTIIPYAFTTTELTIRANINFLKKVKEIEDKIDCCKKIIEKPKKWWEWKSTKVNTEARMNSLKGELNIMVRNFYPVPNNITIEQAKEQSANTIKDNLRILKNTYEVASVFFTETCETKNPSRVYGELYSRGLRTITYDYCDLAVPNFILSSTSYSASRILALKHNRIQEELVGEGIIAKNYESKNKIHEIHFISEKDELMLPTTFDFARTIVQKNQKVTNGEFLFPMPNNERLKQELNEETEHANSLLKTEWERKRIEETREQNSITTMQKIMKFFHIK